MNFGLKARDLILELKRSEGIPPFNDDQVRTIQREMANLWHEIEEETADVEDPSEVPDSVRVFLITYKEALERNKRLLLAYVVNRARRLQRMRWSTGPVLPREVTDALSPSEREFFRRYDTLLGSYSAAVGVDLTATLAPPTELLLSVRALKDVGRVMTESGEISLERGCEYSLRRNDVEQLIRQGVLELIDNEESCGSGGGRGGSEEQEPWNVY